MSLVAKLLLLFTIVPLLEMTLLITMGTYVGPIPTILLVLFTGLVGAFLAKREGLKVWTEWKRALSQATLPEDGIVGGLLVLVGGVLLVTPGVLTDLTGFALLVPKSRRIIAKYVKAYFEKKFAEGGTTTRRVRVDLGGGRFVERVETHFGGRRDPNVIDVEGEVIEERRRGEGPRERLVDSETA